MTGRGLKPIFPTVILRRMIFEIHHAIESVLGTFCIGKRAGFAELERMIAEQIIERFISSQLSGPVQMWNQCRCIMIRQLRSKRCTGGETLDILPIEM